MIFGEIATDKNYYDFYPELLDLVRRHFKNVESGVQGGCLHLDNGRK